MWYLHTDVAISAPYGVDGSGKALPGTVYIYAGAGNDVIHQTAIQVMVTYTLCIIFAYVCFLVFYPVYCFITSF